MRRDTYILSVAALCLTVSATAWAAYDPAEIEVEAISPREINEGAVDTTRIRQSSSGLPVVGVGEQVYLKALGGTGFTGARAYTWTLTARPAGATAALTALQGDSWNATRARGSSRSR
ncbi:MAG: hypothetical protein A3F84_14245 [Candidatus Handelsmanbacteria bacterium RIFCSPLOWO2_12_FULL_64_10]|uniref:Uncharacterized protein n=1 Tax=Handelsmanbacteria sp. (strain RIFCSPLOWO2_12_FULL_64_10) TaxID=1817868 RepID=A0A1F6CIC0_HANXR|nr:MAG: hypothetical protein A3F84_14245 [Candidatus Handelsmanbacteria bacterium RIFCSPLOWO2_12_FULL_64_10]